MIDSRKNQVMVSRRRMCRCGLRFPTEERIPLSFLRDLNSQNYSLPLEDKPRLNTLDVATNRIGVSPFPSPPRASDPGSGSPPSDPSSPLCVSPAIPRAVVRRTAAEMPYSPAFLRICKLFPNKTGRLEAWRVWARLLRDFPEGQLEALSTAAIAWLAKTDQWQRGVVPHLRTWLNGRRFQDEKTPTKARTTGWAGVPDAEYPDGEQKI